MQALGPAPGSINDLCGSPRFLNVFFTFRFLADLLAHHGPGSTMSWWDVPRAFIIKRNPTNAHLLFLAVSQLATSDEIVYFVELANTFGWTPANGAGSRC